MSINISRFATAINATSRRMHIVLLVLALMGAGLSALVLMGWAGGAASTTEESATFPAAEETPVPLTMTMAIPIIFDANNPYRGTYDWALMENEDEQETLLEEQVFEHEGKSYTFLLSTMKAVPTDDDYTVPDYLTLTLEAADTEGTAGAIVYIDLGADGILDSVYVNDTRMTDEKALLVAQSQYVSELLYSTDYLLNG